MPTYDGDAELPPTSQSSSGQKYSLTPQVSTTELQYLGTKANKGIATSREMPRALVESIVVASSAT